MQDGHAAAGIKGPCEGKGWVKEMLHHLKIHSTPLLMALLAKESVNHYLSFLLSFNCELFIVNQVLIAPQKLQETCLGLEEGGRGILIFHNI